MGGGVRLGRRALSSTAFPNQRGDPLVGRGYKFIIGMLIIWKIWMVGSRAKWQSLLESIENHLLQLFCLVPFFGFGKNIFVLTICVMSDGGSSNGGLKCLS
ncbi:MAG TPA: hypothetical protein DCZ49_04025 [Hyphomonadaceae bacterium]|nr:hypothetical protein [Hyphomonadaceae bacterium]